MLFVENVNQVNWNQLSLERVFVFPILSDFKLHRCKNRISAVYIKSIDSQLEYVVGCYHGDLNKNGVNWINDVNWSNRCIVYNSKYMDVKGIDADLINWMITGDKLNAEYTSTVSKYKHWYWDMKNVIDSVPIVSLVDYIRAIYNEFQSNLLNNSNEFRLQLNSIKFYNDLISDYKCIENGGININTKISSEFFNCSDEKLFTDYNTFTTTGRPSNAFGGINFSALDKSNGVRSMIIPFENSSLYEFDFDSYHIRLIADLIGYNLPKFNLHTYFGRMYFNTPSLTPEQYEESKHITFKAFYGQSDYRHNGVEFFNKVSLYKNELIDIYNKDGFIELPISKRKIIKFIYGELNLNKLFNYLIQAHETEVNGVIIRDLVNFLKDKKSKLILYTYDSFLFSIHNSEGWILEKLNEILLKFNVPVSLKTGNDYQNMKKVKSVI